MAWLVQRPDASRQCLFHAKERFVRRATRNCSRYCILALDLGTFGSDLTRVGCAVFCCKKLDEASRGGLAPMAVELVPTSVMVSDS